MTAEVAVVNRSAVALAADSIVTISSESGTEKTYNANKLFTLSKHHPVGLMVYGSAEFMKVPWETVVKQYRKWLGKKCFGTIEQYAEAFFSWLAESELIVPEDHQSAWLEYVGRSYFRHQVRANIDKRVENFTSADNKKITQSQLKKLIATVVVEHYEGLNELKDRGEHLAGVAEKVAEKFGNPVEKWCQEEFGELPLTQATRKKLAAMPGLLLNKSIPLPNSSGLVVAGFGEDEVFPVIKAFHVFGCAAGYLVYDIDTSGSLEAGGGGVIPYAQRDVAQTFLQGVDPALLGEVRKYLKVVLNRLPTIVADHLPGDDDKRLSVVQKLEEVTESVLDEFETSVGAYLEKYHRGPLLAIIEHLPKEELADLAESLLSLTATKQKMSKGIETVGGPIDVAVISKGDGFVWLRRKHYFRPELNVPFIENYFDR